MVCPTTFYKYQIIYTTLPTTIKWFLAPLLQILNGLSHPSPHISNALSYPSPQILNNLSHPSHKYQMVYSIPPHIYQMVYSTLPTNTKRLSHPYTQISNSLFDPSPQISNGLSLMPVYASHISVELYNCLRKSIQLSMSYCILFIYWCKSFTIFALTFQQCKFYHILHRNLFENVPNIEIIAYITIMLWVLSI